MACPPPRYCRRRPEARLDAVAEPRSCPAAALAPSPRGSFIGDKPMKPSDEHVGRASRTLRSSTTCSTWPSRMMTIRSASVVASTWSSSSMTVVLDRWCSFLISTASRRAAWRQDAQAHRTGHHRGCDDGRTMATLRWPPKVLRQPGSVGRAPVPRPPSTRFLIASSFLAGDLRPEAGCAHAHVRWAPSTGTPSRCCAAPASSPPSPMRMMPPEISSGPRSS